MAITIVGESAEARKQAVCGNCGAVLEYTLADTTVETVRDYGGGSDTYRRLNCPRCGNTITVRFY